MERFLEVLGKRVRVKVRVSVRVRVRVRLRVRVRDLNCLDRSRDMKLFWKLFLDKVIKQINFVQKYPPIYCLLDCRRTPCFQTLLRCF